MAVHNHGTVMESDPHTYYCAECRATFDFHHPSGCTCTRIQEFVVMHRNSHTADTKRIQTKTSVNIRSAEKLGLVDRRTMCDEPYQVDTNPHTLRDRIAAAIQKAHAERPLRFSLLDTWDENCLEVADAVIRVVSAYRYEVSEDDFFDALSEADDDE